MWEEGTGEAVRLPLCEMVCAQGQPPPATLPKQVRGRGRGRGRLSIVSSSREHTGESRGVGEKEGIVSVLERKE